MSEEKDLSQLKKEAVEKARAASLARKQAKEKQEQEDEGSGEDMNPEVAKKKAAALAKEKAIAKAKAAAAVKAKMKDKQEPEVETTPEPPSPNEPLLRAYVSTIESELGANQCEDYYINKLSKDVPTILAKPHTYFELARILKTTLHFDFLSELHGSDFETHMEVYVHLYSFQSKQSVALKVKLDRENPIIPSLVGLWSSANWPECEAYDLLGIQFSGHPNLTRIFLGEDWVGYPLRKDYEPYDVEV